MRAPRKRLTLIAGFVLTAILGLSCTNDEPKPPRIGWNAPRPRVVSDWRRESPFTYNLYSDVDGSGRFVAFTSSVRDGPSGVYLRNMRTSAIIRLDVWYTGNQPVPGSRADERYYRLESASPAISTNGRFVAFHSASPYLVRGDGNGSSDVFVYDRKSSRLRLVSTNSEGAQADGDSVYPSISEDGRFIAFSSRADNLVGDVRTHRMEIYVKDTRTGRVQLIGGGVRFTEGRRGTALGASIANDGSRVAFTSNADDLVPRDDNRARDAFVAALDSGEISRVSISSDGDELDPFEYEESASSYRDGVGDVAISGDGQIIVFSTHANGLVPEDDNNNVDVYVHDLRTRRTERVSITSNGDDAYRNDDRDCGGNGQCFGFIASHSPSLTHDGRYVAFISGAPLLDPRDVDRPNGTDEDVFVHDRDTGLTLLVNRSFRGVPAPGSNLYAGSISGDGRWISFSSDGRLLPKKRGRGENGDIYLQELPVPFVTLD